MAKTRVAANGKTPVSYELRGQRWRRRKPWLVLINGLGFDRTGWRPVRWRLGRRFRLVLVDNRGPHVSGGPRRSATVADLARDVVAVLDDAGVGRAHVVGLSLGGMVAQELAIRRPDRVARLVLVGTTPGWPVSHLLSATQLLHLRGSAGLPPEAALRRGVEHALSPTTVRERPRVAARLVGHLRRHEQDPAAAAALARSGVAYTTLGRGAFIEAPTLVLHGGDDSVVAPGNGHTLARAIPDARLVVMPDAGHLLHWERPRVFADIITEFLQEDDQVAAPSPSGDAWRARVRSWLPG